MKSLLVLSLIVASLLGARAFSQETQSVHSIVGIGATLSKLADGSVEISGLIPDAPAERAGLLIGDLIEEVQTEPQADWVETRTKTLEEVVALIRGPEGTPVTLGLRRGSLDPARLTILREKFEIEDKI